MPLRPFLAALCALFLFSSAPVPRAQADAPGPLSSVSGRVFDDTDGDGVQGVGEGGRPGVAVTNGRDVVLTGADGGYTIAARESGFVSLTCPADARCPVSFHRRNAAGFDFGLAPREAEGDLFFVHVSDAHVYPGVEDMAALLPDGGLPWYVPRVVAGWVLLYQVDKMYPNHSRDEIVAALREAVSPLRDTRDAWDADIVMDYMELALDPSTGLVDPVLEIPHAFGEIAALVPAFVVHTGDLVLEGNEGTPEATERWFDYYHEVSNADGLEIYETIGNNELVGTSREDVRPPEPRYGKALFQRELGPTHYSFERGPFHFAALDTHRPFFDFADSDADEEWSFYEMPDGVRDWLDADLARAREAGKTLVVLNHEPFFYDPDWDFDEPESVEDHGLLAKHGVAYTLTGHTHKNGFQDAPPGGGTTHISTGALSGFRWMLPRSIDSRGYRLFYAREGRLYSAWKELDAPVLGFVDPVTDPDEGASHPGSTHPQPALAVDGVRDVVGVGVDIDQPFATLAVWLDGEPLETERWGNYFVRASLDASRLRGSGRLELRATTRDGTQKVARAKVVVAGYEGAPR